jgi:signal transduction histidine kinase
MRLTTCTTTTTTSSYASRTFYCVCFILHLASIWNNYKLWRASYLLLLLLVFQVCGRVITSFLLLFLLLLLLVTHPLSFSFDLATSAGRQFLLLPLVALIAVAFADVVVLACAFSECAGRGRPRRRRPERDIVVSSSGLLSCNVAAATNPPSTSRRSHRRRLLRRRSPGVRIF